MKVNQVERVLVDGGVFANNPAACAFASSKKLFPEEDVVLLSVGTGRLSRSIQYVRSKRFGKISWIKPLINVMFASVLDCVNYQLEQFIDNKYLRIQFQLTVASPDMDNVAAKNIECLQKEAQMMVECNQKAIDRFCEIHINSPKSIILEK